MTLSQLSTMQLYFRNIIIASTHLLLSCSITQHLAQLCMYECRSDRLRVNEEEATRKEGRKEDCLFLATGIPKVNT
jgi:hypothetical protein